MTFTRFDELMLCADLDSWSADDLRFALVLLGARLADITAEAGHEADGGD